MFTKFTVSAVAALAVLASSSQADAFGHHRWHGSSGGGWGGSSGGWGGSSGGGWGGSSGGWGGGSSGGWGGGSSGGYGGGWHARHHGGWRWGGSSGGSSGGYMGGSSGGFGSSGGGWGGSSGGFGSSGGGWGSTGGSSGGGGAYYYSPDVYSPDVPMTPVDPSVVPALPPAAAPPAGTIPAPAPAPAPGLNTSIPQASGLLAVNVPEDAKIYVNGQATTSTGAARQYVSRNLQPGFNYNYEVRAEVVRDGRTIEQVKKVDLRAGQTANLAFDFPATETTETSLTVHVPSDAKVFLAGNATKAAGETRVFRTTGLSGSKAWNDYTVRVELERGGRTIVKEETISLKAGESKELRFDLDGDKIASR